MRILIVEDEVTIADSIKKGLEQESYAVDVAYDGQAGYDLAATEEYDVVVLDRMLPQMSGMEVCAQLREDNNPVPILMLTALGQTHDRVEGLNSGADDYLPKPFSFDELVARIHALTRRPKQRLGNILKNGDLKIDTLTKQVTRSGKPVQLSKKEYALLTYLMQNANIVVSKEQLMQHVWDYDADVLPNTVEVYIGYLRNKIDKPFPDSPPLINTVRGFGYKIGA